MPNRMEYWRIFMAEVCKIFEPTLFTQEHIISVDYSTG